MGKAYDGPAGMCIAQSGQRVVHALLHLGKTLPVGESKFVGPVLDGLPFGKFLYFGELCTGPVTEVPFDQARFFDDAQAVALSSGLGCLHCAFHGGCVHRSHREDFKTLGNLSGLRAAVVAQIETGCSAGQDLACGGRLAVTHEQDQGGGRLLIGGHGA